MAAKTREPIVFNVIANDSRGVYKICKVYGIDADDAMSRFDTRQPFGADFEAHEAHPCGEADPSGVIGREGT